MRAKLKTKNEKGKEINKRERERGKRSRVERPRREQIRWGIEKKNWKRVKRRRGEGGGDGKWNK